MLYLINGKYYVNTSPMIYTEVILSEKNGEGMLSPTKNKIEVNPSTVITQVNLKDEVAKLLAKKPVDKPVDKPVETSSNIKPRFSRYSRK